VSHSLDALILRGCYSLRELVRLSGAAKTTVIRRRRKLRQQFPDNPDLQSPSDDAAPAVADSDNQLFLPAVASELAPKHERTSSSACDEYRAEILTMLNDGFNSMNVWRALIERHGVPFGYDTVKRYINKLRPVRVFNRIEHEAAWESQSDFGRGAPTFNSETGKFQRPLLFAYCLSYSRWHYACVVWKSSQKIWCQLHEAAFKYMNGCPKTLRIDNLREGVTKSDPYEPQLNALFKECMEYYGVQVIPCRPFSPNEKGKVERVIKYIQQALEGRRFDSIGEQNTYLQYWAKKYAFEREHGTTKRIVREAFAEELPHLQKLPLKSFEYYERFERTVHIDGAIEVNRAYYSAPKPYAGQRIIVHMTDLILRLIDPKTHQLIREHPRAQHRGQRSTHPSDLPKVTPPPVLALVDRAKELSKEIGYFAVRVEKVRASESARSRSIPYIFLNISLRSPIPSTA